MTRQVLIERIDALLNNDAYDWAFDFLSDVRVSLTAGGEATEGRIRAVENVERAVSDQQRASASNTTLPSEKYHTSRRYEGYQEEKKK